MNSRRRILHSASLRVLLPLFLLAAAGALPCWSGEIIIDDFADGLDPGWHEKSFAGHTVYTVVSTTIGPALAAKSSNAASGLVFDIDYAPEDFPYLSWQWKVDNIIEKGDARRKSGDDYSARIYVIFPGRFFWQTRAINYIWANRLPLGTAVFNAYTKNDGMIALQSGKDLVGVWVTEKRNILDDYRRIFGSEPGRVGAIAIMTDTDNTGESAAAYYGPIIVGSE